MQKQVTLSVNVWAGMCGDKILGPHIFNANLNAERYLGFLNTHFQEYWRCYGICGFSKMGRPPITL